MKQTLETEAAVVLAEIEAVTGNEGAVPRRVRRLRRRRESGLGHCADKFYILRACC